MSSHNIINSWVYQCLIIMLIPCLNSCNGGGGTSSSSSSSGSSTIESITVTADVAQYPYLADLWASTWADDDNVYFAFGDGTGTDTLPTRDGLVPGAFVTPWAGYTQPSSGCFHVPTPPDPSDPLWIQTCRTFDCTTASACNPISHFTDGGIAVMSGSPPNFTACSSSSCIVDLDVPNEPVPTGEYRNDDKVSSLLFVNGVLYFAGHNPSGSPVQGWIATSSDKGKKWTIVAGTPWTGGSVFRVLMLINMGQAYDLNTDGYVYALGTPYELNTSTLQNVYLARVPVGSIANYSAYQYLSAVDANSNPTWSSSQAAAIPLAGLSTFATGSAIYHGGTKQYLFLAGDTGSGSSTSGILFAAPEPWGPWSAVGKVPGTNIAMLISKGAGATYVYYSAAGGTEKYNLNIGRIDLKVSN